jgi:hypothetical protein
MYKRKNEQLRFFTIKKESYRFIDAVLKSVSQDFCEEFYESVYPSFLHYKGMSQLMTNE